MESLTPSLALFAPRLSPSPSPYRINVGDLIMGPIACTSYWVAASKGKIGEIYNIGGDKTFKISKFLKILKNKSNVKIKSKLEKKLLRKTDVTLQIPNSNKFKKHTGWKPLVSFEDSLDKFLKIFRNKK